MIRAPIVVYATKTGESTSFNNYSAAAKLSQGLLKKRTEHSTQFHFMKLQLRGWYFLKVLQRLIGSCKIIKIVSPKLLSLNCNSQNRVFRPFLKTSLAKQASYRAQNGGLVASCQIILWHVFLWIEEPTFKHSLLTWLLFTKSPTYLYNIKIQSFSNQIPFNFTSFGRSTSRRTHLYSYIAI